MMNVERRQAAANPQTRPNDPGCESARGLRVPYRRIYPIRPVPAGSGRGG